MPNLSPPLQQYFQKLKPMEPVSARSDFSDPGLIFQVKWDGVRILAFVSQQGVRLQNRKGFERTLQYPEFQVLKETAGTEEMLIDGEAVVLEEGRPSFSRIIERDFSKSGQRIKRLSEKFPCTYCIFDLLFYKGEDITSLPLLKRQEILHNAFERCKSEAVYVNNNFTDGSLLYKNVIEKELEGIVAKNKNSPYIMGRKSRHWLKIKPRRRQLSVVGGLITKGGEVSSLLLGAYHDGKLLYIGRAGSGLSSSDRLLLKNALAQLRVSAPCFINPPRKGEISWFKPVLTAEIEFMEWTDNLMMRAPVIKGFSTLPPDEALL